MAAAAAAGPREILTGAVSAEKLANILIPRDKWHPYATAAERAAWESLPADARSALVATGEQALTGPWGTLPATVFLEYKRVGNRSHYEAIRDGRRNRLRQLVVAECVEGKGRFLDEIVNGIWLTCEETWWGVPAHLNMQKAGPGLADITDPAIDLFAAETSMLLGWTLYLLEPALAKVSPLVPDRIHLELDRRILGPALARNTWSWMGLDDGGKPNGRSLNNWTPWICSNWLTTALIAERDPGRRRAAVAKILRVLDNFLNGYADDGGCDEGPSYWNVAGGALFDNLELLYSATDGKFDVYSKPLVGEIGRYVYRAHIAGDYYTNFADAPAKVHIDGNMVWRYGRRIGDEKMAALGAWAAKRHEATTAGSLGRQLPRLFSLTEMRQAPAGETLVRDVWLPGIQAMMARIREGSAEGFYLAAHGGHNAESHNHNDVGDFVVYAGGKPVIIDVGVETYSAKTFSAQRYEIWTMQSAYHNLPTIDGTMQAPGRQYAARDVGYRCSDATAELALDIAGAYPQEAGVKSWKRTLRLERTRNLVEVRDQFALARAPKEIILTLMTPCEMQPTGPGVLSLKAPETPEVQLEFDSRVFQASQEAIEIKDSRLRASWGGRLYRILLRTQNSGKAGAWTLRIREASKVQ